MGETVVIYMETNVHAIIICVVHINFNYFDS